eukprot:EG_transcript_38116
MKALGAIAHVPSKAVSASQIQMPCEIPSQYFGHTSQNSFPQSQPGLWLKTQQVAPTSISIADASQRHGGRKPMLQEHTRNTQVLDQRQAVGGAAEEHELRARPAGAHAAEQDEL